MRDIKHLDLNLLKALDALLDERSVSRAAERLGVTQPAVSGMLVRLRDSFDEPLFVRVKRGIVPTLRATQLAAPVKQLLGDVGALLSPIAFDPATADFTITLAATDYAVQAIVSPFVTRLRALAPGIRLATCTLEQDRLQLQLERGDLDLALATPETTPAGLRTQRLFDEEYVCVMRAHHADAGAAPLTIDRFCALDHALVSLAGERFRGVTDDVLARIGRQRRVVLSFTSFLALVEVLRVTDLVAVVPRRLVAGVAGLHVSAPPVAIPGFTKVAAWHERTHRDEGQRWARALLFETCGAAA